MYAFTTTTQHPSERVADLLINAVETVSAYWCSNINPVHEGDLYDIDHPDWKWEVTVGDSGRVVTITRAELQEGLKIFQEVVPHQFSLWVNEGDDAITADCFLQCTVLKDVIYG